MFKTKWREPVLLLKKEMGHAGIAYDNRMMYERTITLDLARGDETKTIVLLWNVPFDSYGSSESYLTEKECKYLFLAAYGIYNRRKQLEQESQRTSMIEWLSKENT